MQTLEQIVHEATRQAAHLGVEMAAACDKGNSLRQDETLAKLAKLREDAICKIALYIEERVQHEINVVLGMSN